MPRSENVVPTLPDRRHWHAYCAYISEDAFLDWVEDAEPGDTLEVLRHAQSPSEIKSSGRLHPDFAAVMALWAQVQAAIRQKQITPTGLRIVEVVHVPGAKPGSVPTEAVRIFGHVFRRTAAL